ncbi:ANGPT2 [Mytilus coruscus]|uniref:ANGPT2 n=1 Tax=Mytilus coruscus TaxID=42192 RepID=A0A6J8EM43_MYTCO|nr:ANGPT2 [Mytilus coruscus]
MAILNLYWIGLFCVPFLNGFLLDNKTPTPNRQITDEHFISVIKLVAAETKARHQLETVVAQLHRSLLAKTCNITVHQNQIKLIMELKHEVQGLKNKTDMLEQNVQQLKFENSAFVQNNSILQKTHSQLMFDHEHLIQKRISNNNQSSEIFKQLYDLKQAQTKGKLQYVNDINILQTNTEALTKQINFLRSNQVARGQDILDLINQTLVFRSDVDHDIAKMNTHTNESHARN